MAECYHFDCRPSNAAQDSFRTLMSQFDGTCTSCQEKYAKGDKIAYFGNKNHRDGNQSTRPANSQPAASGISEKEALSLRKKVAQLEALLPKISMLTTLVDVIDWGKLPKVNGQPDLSPAVAAAAIFDGKAIDQGEGDDAF